MSKQFCQAPNKLSGLETFLKSGRICAKRPATFNQQLCVGFEKKSLDFEAFRKFKLYKFLPGFGTVAEYCECDQKKLIQSWARSKGF